MKYLYYGGGIIIAIVVLSLLFSLFFAGAEVTVTPKTDTLTVQGEFRAVSDRPESGEVQFQIMSLEESLSEVVPATGREEVEERASGQIVIFNTHSENVQPLIRNTRFETPEGLIYRINKSIVVPGMDGDTPGSIEVTVYGDEPGEKYNIGLTDFTIPGFQGAPQFETFYAESKTAMTGGFVGERLQVEEATLTSTRNKLRAQLESNLKDQVGAEQPTGFISFPNAMFVEFTSETPEESGQEVRIMEKAVLYNVLFAESDLAKFLASETLGSFDGSSVTFRENVNLNITPKSLEGDNPIAPWSDGALRFDMSGSADIVWQFDETELKKDLSGRNKEAIHTILSGYPSIDEAEVVIRPFWKGSFPGDVEEIKVEVKDPE